MKTISDFKKRLRVGVKLHTVYHQSTNGTRDEKGQLVLHNEDKGIREISIVQSNSFALKTEKKDGTFNDSWCSYPKSKEIVFIDENTVQLLCEDFRNIPHGETGAMIPLLTYKFV